MKLFFYACCLMFFLVSCKSTEQTSTNSIPQITRYAIGQGGGFTGDYQEFILSEDGKVHKYDFIYDREVYFKELSKADLIYFIEKLESLSLEGVEIHEPGNMSYYIDVRLGRISINKIVWGNFNYSPDQEMVDLHKELFKKLSEWD